MNILHAFILVLLLVPVPLFASVSTGGVVATVGEVPITAFELSRQVERVLPLRSNFHGSVSADKVRAIKLEALNDLIERGYKIKYALDNEISVPVSMVDAQIDKLRNRYKSKKEFIDATGAETISGLRASIYRKFLAEKAEEVAVNSKVQVDDVQIRAYYAENMHTFFVPKQFRASHILVKVDPASNDEERKALKQKADEVLLRAQGGEDFFDLAYFNSDDRTKFVGGDLGMFHEGQTEKPFEDALLAMKVGDISDLVWTRFGYHIIKLTQVNEPRQMSYDEAYLTIRARLEKDLREELYVEWLGPLKNKYKVERTVE